MIKRILWLFCLVVSLHTVFYVAIGQASTDVSNEKIMKLRLPFIANDGQADEKVRFYAPTFGGTVYVTKDGELVYSLPKVEEKKSGEGVALKEVFIGGKVGSIRGEGKAMSKVNYFKGKDKSKWKRNIPTYETVNLGEVYEGVELKLKAYGNNVEKLFYVKSGVSPEKIGIKMCGGKALAVNKKGELEVDTELGVVRFTKPIAYQEADNKREPVEVAYVILKENTYGFKVSPYDKKRPLIIDPLLASTFLGGGSGDGSNSLVLDGEGNVYVTGGTGSSGYPTTPGAYDENINGGSDVFVSKLSRNLDTLLASTFLGGGSDEEGKSLAIDVDGNVYVTGITYSSDYPTTPGVYDENYDGFSGDGFHPLNVGGGFVSKLSGGLDSLLASTFIGGNGDSGGFLALNGDGDVYVTTSVRCEYMQGDCVGPGSGDVHKLSGDLSTLLASTDLCDDGDCFHGIPPIPRSLALDGDGNVYVAGRTGSSDFPTTPGAYDENHNGDYDVFVSKLSGDLRTLLASTFIGGTGDDDARSLALDGDGNVYVAGETNSLGYPTILGAYDGCHSGGEDVFISKLSGDLSADPYNMIIVELEAESAESITIPMQVANDGAASGGQYIWVPGQGNNWDGTGGYAEYTVNVTTEGEYVLWGRAIAPTGSDDSFFVEVGDSAYNAWSVAKGSSWQWDLVNIKSGVDPVKYYLTTGIQTIKIGQREDGTKLDKLILTNDMNYIPTGIGGNSRPTANDDPVATSEYTPVTINLVDNDTDADGTINPVTVDIVDNPANGTAVHNCDGTVTYSPDTGYIGTDTFTYTVQDDDGAISNEATVAVSVTSISDPNGYYWLEAESAERITSPMQVANDGAASGGQYIWVPGNGNNWDGTGGYAEYKVNVTKEGEYVLWGRVIAPNSSADSFFAKVGSSANKPWSVADGSSWQWDLVNIKSGVDPVKYYLTTGIQTIKIGQREDGTKLDKLLLTSDMDFMPADVDFYAIGDTGPAGGIVFYVTDGGLRGLEAAPADQHSGFGAAWGCKGTAISGADGTGAQNTADILAGCSEAGIAAEIADAYTYGGYDDWFLPSADELNLLHQQRAVVGGFANSSYWSSSEYSSDYAWYQQFGEGFQDGSSKKNHTLSVRAVRAF